MNDLNKIIGKDEINQTRSNFFKNNEIHVWQVPLNNRKLSCHTLSLEEKQRAERFRRLEDHNRYVHSHVLLRKVLSFYTNISPENLYFNKTNYGKPFLITNEKGRDVYFNMSYSKNKVCYVISKVEEVGIDVEYVNLSFDWQTIAKLYFSMKEVIDLQALPDSKQVKAFFNLWTKKEALLKAKGVGLNGLEELNIRSSTYDDYFLTTFDCGKDYQGSLAIKSRGSRYLSIRYIQLDLYSNAEVII